MKNKSNILFITGTDTNVGKTVVTSLLVNYLVRVGVDVSVVKPIETGCRSVDGELVGADEEILHLAMGGSEKKSTIVFSKFKTPVAPQVAEELEGKSIDLDLIKKQILEASLKTKLLIVEGAGGLLVPISGGYSYADLIADCEMNTLLVVGSRLGALNHAALTMEVLSARGLPSVGYVLNDLEGKPFSGNLERTEDCSGARLPEVKSAPHNFRSFDLTSKPASPGKDVEARFTNRKMLSEIAEKYGQSELAFLPKLSRDLESYLTEESSLEELEAIGDLSKKVRSYFSL